MFRHLLIISENGEAVFSSSPSPLYLLSNNVDDFLLLVNSKYTVRTRINENIEIKKIVGFL